MAKAKLIPPYGGKLVNLVVEGKEREELLARAGKLPSIKITMRNLCDLELIATGGFSPLTTFMGKADYDRVLKEMQRQGVKPKMLVGLTSSSSMETLQGCGAQAEGMIIPTSFAPVTASRCDSSSWAAVFSTGVGLAGRTIA